VPENGDVQAATQKMTFFIGTDEAGYGPNLGPLLITATAWRFPPGTSASRCWALLSNAISESAPEESEQLHVADSKRIYSSGRSIEPLEKSVLSVLKRLNHTPSTFRELGTAVAGNAFLAAVDREKCLASTPIDLPLKTNLELIERSSRRLKNTLRAASIELITVRSRVIFPAEFNQLVETEGSKGRVLSMATLKMVADIVQDERLESAQIICDKHGGRNRYDALLSEAFEDQLVFRLEEGRQLSRYRMKQLEFRFQTGAEEHLPVAVASMVSKYLREVAMLEFNAFWREFVPELKATQGYPVDAARFLRDIESELERQQIPKEQIWRRR